MARYERFTFLCNQYERALIAMLAEHLRRSQSDAVRFVVLDAARELVDKNAKPTERDAAQPTGAIQNALAR